MHEFWTETPPRAANGSVFVALALALWSWGSPAIRWGGVSQGFPFLRPFFGRVLARTTARAHVHSTRARVATHALRSHVPERRAHTVTAQHASHIMPQPRESKRHYANERIHHGARVVVAAYTVGHCPSAAAAAASNKNSARLSTSVDGSLASASRRRLAGHLRRV